MYDHIDMNLSVFGQSLCIFKRFVGFEELDNFDHHNSFQPMTSELPLLLLFGRL